jgi:hypothetical protein
MANRGLPRGHASIPGEASARMGKKPVMVQQ